MGSSRFPGKPMAKIHDKPMIGHVYDNVRRCELIHKTVVATCDEEIAGYIRSINGHAVMTSNSHERASDRCAEALRYIEQEDNIRYDENTLLIKINKEIFKNCCAKHFTTMTDGSCLDALFQLMLRD